MTHPPRSARRAGFTLLEVLVSLAIFALAAVVLGATYVNVLNSYDAVARRQQSEQDVRLVRAAVLAEPDRKKVEEGGELALPGNRRARWEAKIEEGAVADLFRVALRCEVTDPAQVQPLVREENFMLLRPGWSEAAAKTKLREASRARLEQERRK